MKHLFLLLLQCLLVAGVFSQSCPPNLDFEKGDLSNWKCSIGSTYAVGSQNFIDLVDTIPIPGRHEIISANTPDKMDPYGNFPKLCPYGGDYSVKLGNNLTGNEAEGISYTFRIPATVDTLTFTYFYAVVFEDPQHAMPEQPRFFVTAYDVVTGGVINCASYDYVSTSSLPGFTASPDHPGVLYKNWSPVSLQFAGLNGRLVRLEFKTADCTQGGHFGYAYLDVGTACSNILATAPYCIETNSLILNAPYGFKQYTWYNSDFTHIVGSGESITISPPPATTGTFYVDMIPYPGFGCRDTASATVVPLPVPGMPIADTQVVLCQYSVAAPLMAIALKDHELLWYRSATGGIPVNIPPIPSTMVTDTVEYFVSQKKLFGCESFRKKIRVIIKPTPVASYNPNALSQCQKGNEFILTSTSTNLSNSKYYWDLGDGSIDSSGIGVIHYNYINYGTYHVKLKVVNQEICGNETEKMVTVVPSPVANFSFPEVMCEKQTSIDLLNTSYAPENIGVINQWKWDVDGSSLASKNVHSFIPANAGQMIVRLSVSTQEGCLSDTISRTFTVHHRPVAKFSFDNMLCENEMIKLKDLSNLPGATDNELINKWSWEYDGVPSVAIQHPSCQLVHGEHRIKLISTTNFGCMSLPAESVITVYSKPSIALNINDSCILRNISYTAQDLSGLVNNWYWDFGNGSKRGKGSYIKTYQREGDQSLVLIGETDKGCKDTIVRPFRIYDNKSFAGRDTTVARDQPVYLNAGGGAGVAYTWTPADGLSDPAAEKPVAILDRDQQYALYSVTDKGCDSKSKIFIKRYKGPDIYIPNAFTPNGDGKNDALMVVPIGIRSFVFLSVYNRFGQQVYYGTDLSKGWDGIYNGRPQDTGNYIAVSKAIDYNGHVMVKRENVVLLR
jgi:gliding motility-associated-like protein